MGARARGSAGPWRSSRAGIFARPALDVVPSPPVQLRAVSYQFGEAAFLCRQFDLEPRLELIDVLAGNLRVRRIDKLIVSFEPGAQMGPEVAHPLLALQCLDRHVCERVDFN